MSRVGRRPSVGTGCLFVPAKALGPARRCRAGPGAGSRRIPGHHPRTTWARVFSPARNEVPPLSGYRLTRTCPAETSIDDRPDDGRRSPQPAHSPVRESRATGSAAATPCSTREIDPLPHESLAVPTRKSDQRRPPARRLPPTDSSSATTSEPSRRREASSAGERPVREPPRRARRFGQSIKTATMSARLVLVLISALEFLQAPWGASPGLTNVQV